MIPYEELCDAISRWRARASGAEESAPAEAAPVYAAEPAPEAPATDGVTPEPMPQETTNEIDIDSLDVVEG
jgi:hypothetical protein